MMTGLRATHSVALIGLGVILGAATTANAGDPQYERIARKMVGTSANIKPGEVVVVNGGKHTIELMEAVAAEVNRLGGMPTMFLNTDKVARARFLEMPEQYLDQDQTYFAEWLKQIDVWISVPAYEDIRAVWGEIPEARLAKSRKSFQVVWDMLNGAKIRMVSLGYPTKEQAAINGLDFTTYREMHWRATNADYQQISERGNYLKKVLQGAKIARVTSPAGTSFSFKIGDRPIFVDDGILTERDAKSNHFLERVASLPGGAVFFAPIETSANGKIVVPRHRCRFQPLTGVTFDFRNGKLQNFKATKGAVCFEETMAPYRGPKDTIGYVSIGLNPEWKVMESPGDFRPETAAGMVTIGIGQNELYGGNNRNTGGFSFPIVKATVEVDGRVVIKDGKLIF